MSLIDRHVLLSFLRVLLWAVLAFVMVFVLIDLFEHIDEFLDDNASTSSILRYYFYQLPMMLDLMLPMGMLLASLFTMGLLSKNREYAAILSAGVSLWRMARPLLLLGLVVAVASLWFREEVVPEANRRQVEVKRVEIEGRPVEDLRARSNFEYIGEGGRVYVVGRFMTRPPTLEGLSVQSFSDSSMVERIDAERAVWEDGRWRLERGSVRRFGPGETEIVEHFRTRELGGPVEAPRRFSDRRADPDAMGYRELAEFSDWVRRTGGDPTPYEAALAHKLSFPMVNFLLVVLGLALGASRQRTTLWSGFGITLGLALLYYLFMNFGLELGKSGRAPILLSAWLGNLLYGAAGLVLFWRANR